ncbi:MAG: DUF3343 domain-containing protein [Negativicutes bacterium]|nr:DUF3343 domain-containing protein [Negativicutes bacterium]
MDCWVITFPAVFHALRAEQILKEQGMDIRLIPIPRELSGSCEGLAAWVPEGEVDRAVALLTAAGVEMVRRGVKAKRI